MTLAIIGSGAWGTTLALVASVNTDVVVYTRDADRAREMNLTRHNVKYLPDVDLASNITFTSTKGDLSSADTVVFAIPSIAFRETVQEFSFIDESVPVLSVTKGLEQSSNMRMSQVILDADPRRTQDCLAVLGGPNLAHEIATGHPAATVVASHSEEIAQHIQNIFHTDTFRVYTSADVVGCEIAGVAKNVIAIAVGIGDALGYGDNAKAAVMTRALAEITRLGVAEGGIPTTFSGLAGIGDLMATCSSELSRNRRVGVLLGQGKTLEEVQQTSHDVAEGLFSAQALAERARALGVEMPIVSAVADTVHAGKVSPDAVQQLMTRPPGRE